MSEYAVGKDRVGWLDEALESRVCYADAFIQLQGASMWLCGIELQHNHSNRPRRGSLQGCERNDTGKSCGGQRTLGTRLARQSCTKNLKTIGVYAWKEYQLIIELNYLAHSQKPAKEPEMNPTVHLQSMVSATRMKSGSFCPAKWSAITGRRMKMSWIRLNGGGKR